MRHIAGNPVQVRNEIVQRCMWCGVVLAEKNVTRVAVAIGPDVDSVDLVLGVRFWVVGHLVEVDGETSDEGEAPPNTDDWPAGCWT